MTIALIGTPKRCSAFALDRERRSSRPAPSPPSTTCLENFSLPGLLIVTTHFDLLNSSEANSIIRAGGGRDSGRGGDRLHRLPPCWWGSSACQVRPPSTRIGSFLRASHALAVDNGGGGAGLAFGLLATLFVERVMDAIQRAVQAPIAKITIDRAARRQVLGKVTPLASCAQHVHDAVDRLSHVGFASAASPPRRRNERFDMRPLPVRQVARISQMIALVFGSNSLWIGKWRLEMKLRQYSTCEMA